MKLQLCRAHRSPPPAPPGTSAQRPSARVVGAVARPITVPCAQSGGGPLVAGFSMGRAAEKVVEEHPAPLQGLLVLVDDDILQIDASVQAGQGEDELGLGDYLVQIDIIVAANLE